jgi:hypothetical protein
MQILVVGTAEGYGELIADFLAQGSRLSKLQVMGIRRGLFTDQAGLFTYKKQMALASSPQILGKRQACFQSAPGDNVHLYSVAEISIGSHSCVSQESYLCAGIHDYRDVTFAFVSTPIKIGEECWVAARSFIGPGVEIGDAAVVGAGSVVMTSVDAETIVAGNPAKLVGKRTRWKRWQFDHCNRHVALCRAVE